MEITTIKTFGVISAVIGCFALIYPKIFHPIIMHSLGMYDTNSNKDTYLNRIPPHLRKQNIKDSHFDNEALKNIKAGKSNMHPGMRGAADMNKHLHTTGSTGRGLMTVVLPLYAVGIVIYLMYTLTKVFGIKTASYNNTKNRSEKHNEYEDSGTRHIKREINPEEKSKIKTKKFEKLLMKIDDHDVTDIELKELKKRLLNTEKQMSKILKAMEMVQKKVVKNEEETHVESVLTHCAKTVDNVKNQFKSQMINTNNKKENNDNQDDLHNDSSDVDEINSLTENNTSSSENDDDDEQNNVNDENASEKSGENLAQNINLENHEISPKTVRRSISKIQNEP